MKKSIKTIIALISASLMALSLIACTNIEKQNALNDYAQSIKQDVVYWEAAQMTADSVKTNDAREYASAMTTMSGYLDKVITNAETRNSQITDPEIKDIDDSYIQFTKDMKDAYDSMAAGLNAQDQAKMDKGMAQLESSLNNMQAYVTKLKDFTEKDEIKSN